MDTMTAFMMGEMNRDKPMKVFDWNKAASIIKEKGIEDADAGLIEDWFATGGTILSDGKIVSEDDTYVYLVSTWATPVLRYGGTSEECYIMEDDVPKEWDGDSGVYWPKSARDIFNG